MGTPQNNIMNFYANKMNFQDAFILDAVSGGIYVWIGKQCTDQERKKAMEYGQEYLGKQVLKSDHLNKNFR